MEETYSYVYEKGEYGFMYPCLIRKNNEKLRRKLIKYGWKPFGSMDGKYISCDHICGEFETTDEQGLENILKNPFDDEPDLVDCGENEELFLAVAALSYETDEFQWFVYPKQDYWFVCDYADIEMERKELRESVQSAPFHCSHKASLEELEKHFKNR